jgi:DNA-binding YbaB/EbfC family protein
MNIGQIMKQMGEARKKMEQVQQGLDKIEVTGSAGGGLVLCLLSAKGEAKKITIDKTLLNPEEGELLEDLILAAFNDAKKKAESAINDSVSSLGLPPC